ncbi:MAG: phytanoyl-CoA dioxygenase family protein [Acidimicrobiales bacterium]
MAARGWSGSGEVVAEEGDVVLAHPLLFHASNANHGIRPRVMAQPAFSMAGADAHCGTDLYPVVIPVARTRPSSA